MINFRELRSEVLYAAKQWGMPVDKIKFNVHELHCPGWIVSANTISASGEVTRAKRDGEGNIVLYVAAFANCNDPIREALEHLACFKEFDESKHPRGQPGNAGQFTDSGGGDEQSDISHEQQISDIVKSLGYDPAKVSIAGDEKTIINGKEYDVAGGFKNFSGGKITINTKNRDPKYLTGVLAHEISHAKFEIVETQFSNQRLDMYKEQNPLLSNDQAMLKLVTEDLLPKVTSPEKYPTYAKLEPFFRNVKGMESGSQVSDYAKLHWDQYKAKGGMPFGYQYMIAINETLAEIARFDAGGYIANVNNLPKPWFDLYKTVQSIYGDSKK